MSDLVGNPEARFSRISAHMNAIFQESTSSYYDWCTPGDRVLRANEHILFHRHVKSRIISISCSSVSKFLFVVHIL